MSADEPTPTLADVYVARLEGEAAGDVEALAVALATALPDSGDDCFWPDAYEGDPEAWESRSEDRDYYRRMARALLASDWLARRDEKRDREAAPAERLCSQCGEQMSAMVKVGTTDGWCATCLDEAAEGESDREAVGRVVERVEAVLLDRTYDKHAATEALWLETLDHLRLAITAALAESETACIACEDGWIRNTDGSKRKCGLCETSAESEAGA